MSLILGVAILIWIIDLAYLSMRKILILFGLVKKPYKFYFFEHDILKPIGVKYDDYHIFSPELNNLNTILKVQEQLKKVANVRYLDSCYFSILSDLQRNKELEEVCRSTLNK